ncbi:MAG: serine/threonine protein kinase, partial [Nocardioidaceae bacterium]|nr:serine/threonine protein kinase [Nocardioidaceae bacterium]
MTQRRPFRRPTIEPVHSEPGRDVTSSILPGTVLGNRYRLEDLLDDVDGARFFRATDLSLGRNVSAYVMPEDDERVLPLLEAARTSAQVGDPHVLRVLDADARSGYAWVINEWGAGQSLDVMVSRQPLPPERSAWLVREVSSAIAAAHSKGLAHGRLAPENVMVTESGTVRLIGFAVDATIQRARLRSGNYPDCDPEEADLLDLGGLLYTALVGRWPGASGSLVRPAPRDSRGPLSPRQVRAGVPRPLDAICARVLARKRPNRTAAQLAAVLTEYLGDEFGDEAAGLPRERPDSEMSASAYVDPPVPDDEELPSAAAAPEPAAEPAPYVDPLPDALPDDELWPDDEADEAAPAAEPTAPLDVARLDDEEPTEAVAFDPEATAVSDGIPDEALLDPGWRRRAPAAPPPPAPDP